MLFRCELKIPKERVAVLIGKKGMVKKEIEENTKTKIKIDTDCNIFITGEDGLALYIAKEVIRAIGRGFNPDIAFLLLKPDYAFELINLKDFAGKSKKALIRLKGRVIGKDGKSRKTIEELTQCYISVYGKTVGVIGASEQALMARKAIEALLRGSPHSSVYRWLERKRRKLRVEKWISP